MYRRLGLLTLIVLIIASNTGFASNFSIFENGVRASGMGGAFVAIANDGSAIFYNPAGIAFQKGTRLQMDSLGVIGLFRFFPSSTPPGTVVPEKGFNVNVKPHLIPVASMYLSKSLPRKLTFGFGLFAPFGLSANATSFKDSDPKNTKFVARFSGSRAALQSFWFQPTVAYRLTENSAFAVGVAWVHTHLFIEQSILNPLDDGVVFGQQVASKVFPGTDPTQAGKSIARLLPEGRSRLAGTSDGPGFNAGYLYRHEKSKTSVGLMWRSSVVHHLSGKASFAFTTGYPLEAFVGKDTIPNLFPAQSIKGSFVTPATYSMGFANSAFWHSTISAQFDIQDYQRFKDVPVNFSITKDVATPAELRLNFSMRNSYIARLGFEKSMSESMTIRAGYIFDRSPVTDASVGPLFPDSSRHNFTVGFSRLMMGNKEFSFFYQAMKFLNRTTNVAENDKVFTNGEYQNFAHLFGFGLRIHLGEFVHPFDR
ncbi:MAG TPA: outer membrane protein transport protein [Acidobacteriota bacterium]|nr:outer membrane protein transport protein [Acidobacteriota bacterium]